VVCCERGWLAGSDEREVDVRDLRRAGVIRSVIGMFWRGSVGEGFGRACGRLRWPRWRRWGGLLVEWSAGASEDDPPMTIV
jgi:hypothetical protein